MIYRLLLCLLLFSGSLHAQEDNHQHSQNFFIPDFIFTLTPRSLTENSAMSLLGEAGRYNYRFSGTFGALAGTGRLFKVTGEYLQQKLGYHFSTGKTARWMRQYAIGGAFRQLFPHPVFTDLEFGTYYSYAPGRNLHSKLFADREIARHIAGSSSYGFSLGVGITPWPFSRLQIDADYDSVIYHRHFSSKKHVEGFGGSLDFYQRLMANVGLGLKAEFRRPYNYYRANLNWLVPQFPGLTIGIFGSHTSGKHSLPSCTTAGFELSYILADPCRCDCSCNSDRNQGIAPTYLLPLTLAATDQVDPLLKTWVSVPAAYIPEVLAIAEQRTTLICRGPPTSSPIPNQSVCGPDPYSFNVSSYFNGGGEALTYSATGLPAGSTIDSSTGVISGPSLQDNSVHAVTVTGTNICGETSQTFNITFLCIAPTSTTIPNQSFCGPNPYSFDVSSFFSSGGGCGGGSLTYSATGLPSGSTINSSTGVISGPNLQDNSVNSVTVTASNICGQTSQTFTISFPCLAPTSVTLVPNSLVNPLSHTQVPLASFYTSPCGQPFTFSLSGSVPPSSWQVTIDPVTGVLDTGIFQESGLFTFNVVGTTTCGSTSQPFTIEYRNQ